MYSMSTISKGLAGFKMANPDSDLSSAESDKIIKVYVRLVFLRIGEIDTLNEKYQAHVSIESRWTVSSDEILSNLSSDDQQRLTDGKSIRLNKYDEYHWHPQLYIENCFGELKEQIKYSAKISKEDNKIYICEHRDIKGLFWEKLELHHFPCDVQDLSISITSMFFHDKVLLIADPYRSSGVNREAFIDQQEWSLYEHVNTEQRYIKDFLFRTGDNEEDDDGQMRDQGIIEDRKRSVLTVTCHAARHADYFFWNGYCLILLITSVSFCTFGIPVQYAVNRLQVSCTLLLTSITFRWTVNRSLPTICYLTSLDKYGILCIFNLVLHSIWHSIISGIAWRYTPDYRVAENSWIAYLDHMALYAFIIVFVAFHIAVLTWLCCVPLKHRKQMRYKDAQYRTSLLEKMAGNSNQSFHKQTNRLPVATSLTVENPLAARLTIEN